MRLPTLVKRHACNNIAHLLRLQCCDGIKRAIGKEVETREAGYWITRMLASSHGICRIQQLPRAQKTCSTQTPCIIDERLLHDTCFERMEVAFAIGIHVRPAGWIRLWRCLLCCVTCVHGWWQGAMVSTCAMQQFIMVCPFRVVAECCWG